MGILSTISNLALKPSTALGNLATAGLEKITGKEYGRTTSKELASTTPGKILGLGIATTAGALVVATGAAASAARVVIPAATKAVVTSPVKTILGTTVAAGIIASGAGTKIVSTTYKGSKTAGEVITGEKSLGGDTIKDVTKTAGIVLGVGAVGAAAGLVAEKVLTGNDNVESLIPTTPASVTSQVAASEIAPTGVTEMPATPQTVSTTTRKKYKKKKIESQRISQIVKINVSAGNRRFLNVNHY